AKLGKSCSSSNSMKRGRAWKDEKGTLFRLKRVRVRGRFHTHAQKRITRISRAKPSSTSFACTLPREFEFIPENRSQPGCRGRRRWFGDTRHSWRECKIAS